MDLQVTEGNLVLQGEGALLFDDLIHTDVGVEVSLNLGVSHDRTIYDSHLRGRDSIAVEYTYQHHLRC